jgi:hypothetical protein
MLRLRLGPYHLLPRPYHQPFVALFTAEPFSAPPRKPSLSRSASKGGSVSSAALALKLDTASVRCSGVLIG